MRVNIAGVDLVASNCQVTGSVEYYRGFCLDQLGAPVEQINGELQLPEEERVVYLFLVVKWFPLLVVEMHRGLLSGNCPITY